MRRCHESPTTQNFQFLKAMPEFKFFSGIVVCKWLQIWITSLQSAVLLPELLPAFCFLKDHHFHNKSGFFKAVPPLGWLGWSHEKVIYLFIYCDTYGLVHVSKTWTLIWGTQRNSSQDSLLWFLEILFCACAWLLFSPLLLFVSLKKQKTTWTRVKMIWKIVFHESQKAIHCDSLAT